MLEGEGKADAVREVELLGGGSAAAETAANTTGTVELLSSEAADLSAWGFLSLLRDAPWAIARAVSRSCCLAPFLLC